MLLETDTI